MRLVFAAATMALAGCSGGGTVPVSGRVTLDGAPLAGATVTYQPIVSDPRLPAEGSYAVTAIDGTYSLRLVGGKASGAYPGAHRVRISAPILDGSIPIGTTVPNRVPSCYHSEGHLTFEVSGGGNADADFTLLTPSDGPAKRVSRK